MDKNPTSQTNPKLIRIGSNSSAISSKEEILQLMSFLNFKYPTKKTRIDLILFRIELKKIKNRKCKN